MKNLKFDEVQDYFDPLTRQPLQMWFGSHHMIVDDLIVHLDGVPLLRNENTGDVYFPTKTKAIINYFVKKAKDDGIPGVSLAPKDLGKKRYSYASKFDFLYSQIDYEYIPGLIRPWDDGFLTPVFFNLSLLNKYSQHPDYDLDLFSETYGSIRRGDEWSINFGINKNNKVIMWLGDIHELPENEKHYLRSENVESDHDIHSEFYDAQIDVVWSDPSKQSTLFHLRRDLKEIATKAWGFDLYSLDGEVTKVIENLHRPIFWEDKHVGPVIEAFNRVFVESLNNVAIKADVAKLSPVADLKGKGSLKVFGSWLEHRLQMKNHAEVMSSFYVLYDFRLITCHLYSDESRAEILRKINNRLGIEEENFDYERIYDSLVAALVSSYRNMISAAKKDSMEVIHPDEPSVT